MNLNTLAAGATRAVTPPLVGSILTSTGSAARGDVAFTGSIAGTVLTVSAIASGKFSPGTSVLQAPAQGQVLAQLTGPAGGVGTYQLSASQTLASQALMAVGDGTRVPAFTRVDGIPMDVQPASGRDLEHLDSLNIQGVLRSVYILGNVQGLIRADGRGGDMLLLPTGLTAADLDTWLVTTVFETWSTGWCRVGVTLQNPPIDQ